MDLSTFNTSPPSNPGRLILDPTTGHLVLENSNVNEIINTNSHNHHQHSYSGAGCDQIGLSQRITQLRKTFISSQRVQTIHTTTVVDYFPQQNQLSDHDSLGDPNEIIKNEIVTTTRNINLRPQLVNAPSTMNRILHQNDVCTRDHTWVNQTQPCSQNLHVVLNSVPNPLITHSLYPENNSFPNPHPSRGQPSNRNVLFDFLRMDQNHTTFPNTSPNGYQHHENRVYVPILHTHEERNEPRSVRVKKTESVLDGEPFSFDFSAENSRITNHQYPNKRRPKNRIEARYLNRINGIRVFVDSSSDEDMDVEGDGITHSLPHKKNGPYTCPTCQNTFDTSQLFAAHVGSAHYRFESKDEKRKGQLAKKRRKPYLRLFQSRDGLTVKHEDFGEEGSGESDASSRTYEADAGITVKDEQDEAAGTSRQPLIQVKVEPDDGVLFDN